MILAIRRLIHGIRLALKPCHKTQLGYNCRHRIYNGYRECD